MMNWEKFEQSLTYMHVITHKRLLEVGNHNEVAELLSGKREFSLKKENVYLLSAMLLMKAAFNKDLEIIRQVFKLWHQLGFMHETERINFLLIYVMETQDVTGPQLNGMLEETKSQGEIAMPTLAQRLRNEGMQQALVTLLTTRFQLNENEKQLIAKIDELKKLTTALKLVVTAQTKEEILASLAAAVH